MNKNEINFNNSVEEATNQMELDYNLKKELNLQQNQNFNINYFEILSQEKDIDYEWLKISHKPDYLIGEDVILT